MPASLIAFLFITFAAFPTNSDVFATELHAENGPAQPALPPDTSTTTSPSDVVTLEAQVVALQHSAASHPTQILIPAIGVNSYVVEVGVNARGEMDVPDGNTLNVGWYKYGTAPGEIGSAVMDAHVYAAFKKLKNAQIGNRIYVVNGRGEIREFKIVSSKVYPRAQVPMETIFTDASGAYLNLITCEGRYSAKDATYTHRRVVYAELVQ